MSKLNSQIIEKQWRRLMKLQTDLLFPVELPFYVRRPEWNNADTVLDLGTGCGYYLCKLASYFPDKQYTGVDFSETHIKAAQKYYGTNFRHSATKLTFVLSDIFDITGQYDAIIARLLIQHLKSLDLFLQTAHRLLRANGALFVIESCDSDRLFLPDVPLLRDFFAALRENRLANGCNRDAGEIVASKASQFGFKECSSDLVTASSVFPSFKERFLEAYLTACDLTRNDFDLDFEYESLKENLQTWYQNPIAYTQLSLRMLCLGKGETLNGH